MPIKARRIAARDPSLGRSNTSCGDANLGSDFGTVTAKIGRQRTRGDNPEICAESRWFLSGGLLCGARIGRTVGAQRSPKEDCSAADPGMTSGRGGERLGPAPPDRGPITKLRGTSDSGNCPLGRRALAPRQSGRPQSVGLEWAASGRSVRTTVIHTRPPLRPRSCFPGQASLQKYGLSRSRMRGSPYIISDDSPPDFNKSAETKWGGGRRSGGPGAAAQIQGFSVARSMDPIVAAPAEGQQVVGLIGPSLRPAADMVDVQRAGAAAVLATPVVAFEHRKSNVRFKRARFRSLHVAHRPGNRHRSAPTPGYRSPGRLSGRAGWPAQPPPTDRAGTPRAS